MAKIYDTAGSKENPVITKEGLTQYHVMIGQTIEDAIGDIDTSQVTQNKTDIESLKSDKADKSDVESLQATVEELQSKGGSASLTIRVECDTKYEGKTFTATSKSDEQTYTAVAENGRADIIIPDGGTYTVTNDLDALSVEVEVDNPLITLAEFYEYTATIKVTVPTALIGSTITCKLDNTTYKVVAMSTSVTFAVHKTGQWTIGVNGNSYISTSVQVSGDNTSYTAEINIEVDTGIPKIIVKVDKSLEGKIIKCSKEGVTLQQTSTNNSCTFAVPTLGEWTLTCDEVQDKEVKVNVAEAKSYSASFQLSAVYTIRIKKEEADPTSRVEYQDDAIGMTPASVEGSTVNLGDWGDTFFFEKIYPVMMKTDGTIDYRLDPNNYAKKVDGDYSDIGQTTYDGNAMVIVEKMYTRFWSDATYEYMSITNEPKSGYVPFGFTDSTGAEIDYTTIAMYLGYADVSSKLRSISGQNIKFIDNAVSISFDIRNMALKNGGQYGLATFAQYQVLDMIFNIIFKTDDCTKLGKGRTGGGEVSDGSYGTIPNHETGLLTESGPIGVDISTGCVKFMHVEDYFSDRLKPLAEMIDGVIITCKTQNTGTLYIKTQRPYATVGSDGGAQTSGYTTDAAFQVSTGNIKTSALDNKYGRVPSIGGATSSTYECDQMYYDSSRMSYDESNGLKNKPKIGCRRGGIRGLGSSFFYSTQYGNFYNFRVSCCARLSYEPTAS